MNTHVENLRYELGYYVITLRWEIKLMYFLEISKTPQLMYSRAFT